MAINWKNPSLEDMADAARAAGRAVGNAGKKAVEPGRDALRYDRDADYEFVAKQDGWRVHVMVYPDALRIVRKQTLTSMSKEYAKTLGLSLIPLIMNGRRGDDEIIPLGSRPAIKLCPGLSRTEVTVSGLRGGKVKLDMWNKDAQMLRDLLLGR